MDSELAAAQERHSAELQEMWRAENEAGKTTQHSARRLSSCKQVVEADGPPTVDCFMCRLLKRKRQTTNSLDSAIQQTGSGPQQNMQIHPSPIPLACFHSSYLQKLLVAWRSLQEQVGDFCTCVVRLLYCSLQACCFNRMLRTCETNSVWMG